MHLNAFRALPLALLTLPFWLCLAHQISWMCDRDDPIESALLVAFMACLIALPAVPPRMALRHSHYWVLGCAGVGILWTVVAQLASPYSVPVGWWRVASRCTALGCLIVGLSVTNRRKALDLLGATAAIVTLWITWMQWHVNMLGSVQCFGYGHINICVNTLGPTLLAWTFVLIGRPETSTTKVWDRRHGLCLLGLVALMYLTICSERRGMPLAWACGCLAVVVMVGFRHIPRVTAVIISLTAAALVYYAWLRFHDPVPDVRGERIALYRAGWEVVKVGFPIGLGPYSAMAIQSLPGEASRHLTATGSWGSHVHSEPLDLLMDGGPVALAMGVAIFALAIRTVWQATDRGLAVGWCALLGAIFAHACTDNVFGTDIGELWLGLVLGLILGSDTPSQPTSFRWPLRLTVWPLAIIGCLAAITLLPSATAHRDAWPAVHARCLHASWNPLSTTVHAVRILHQAVPPVDAHTRGAIVAYAAARMGWTSMYVGEQRRAAAELDDMPLLHAGLIRQLYMNPFFRGGYEDLGRFLRAHPKFVASTSPDLQRRVAYLEGHAQLAEPLWSTTIEDIEGGADLYAALTWAATRGRPWATLSPGLQQLWWRYADVPDVAILLLRARMLDDQNALAWMDAEPDRFRPGLRFGNGLQGLVEEASNADEARRLAPFFRSASPGTLEALIEHRLPAGDWSESTPYLAKLAQLARWVSPLANQP